MTEENKTPNPPKKLTVNDPVPAEVLDQFHKLDEARFNIAIQLLNMEQNRIKLLAAAHQIDEQQRRLYEAVLMERGLVPNAGVEIDSQTGVLRVLEPPKKPVEPPPVKQPETDQPK
jgi:hypothetical protein